MSIPKWTAFQILQSDISSPLVSFYLKYRSLHSIQKEIHHLPTPSPSWRRVAVNILCARGILLPVTHLVAILGGNEAVQSAPPTPCRFHTQEENLIKRTQKKTWRNKKQRLPDHELWIFSDFHQLGGNFEVKAPKGEWYSSVAPASESGNSKKKSSKRSEAGHIKRPMEISGEFIILKTPLSLPQLLRPRNAIHGLTQPRRWWLDHSFWKMLNWIVSPSRDWQ